MGGFSPADLAAMAEFIPPADPKREEPINKLAAVTKPLLPSKDPAQEKKEAKDPEEHKDRTVISTRRGGSEPAPLVSACTANPFLS